ncbi:MAG TPA: NAD-dependent epimerase/dehydratase family protein [Reyranella sp.]|nr:NAD-dependent epimerase/dehydratase family protein [Reyranella sp.]
MPQKKALITGGCGFVGRHLLARLARDDFEQIWIIDNLSTGKDPGTWEKPVVQRHGPGPNPDTGIFHLEGSDTPIHFIKADFLAIALAELGMTPSIGVPKLPPFDEIYHLASVVGGRQVIDNDPLAVGIDLGIDSTFFLWAAKVNRPERILYASSSAAYPISLQEMGSKIALREEMIDFAGNLGKPDYTYGWSKLTGEYLGRIAVDKYKLKVGVVRPFSGYGEDQEPVYPFPAIALRVAARQAPVRVWGSGLQGRDFVHIDDACEACVRTCRLVSDASGVNIGSGKLTTFIELARRMVEIEGYAADVVGQKDMPVGVGARFCDPTHMKKVLNWEPTISLDDGIARALAFAKRRLAMGIKPE